MKSRTFTVAQASVSDPDSGGIGVVAVFRPRGGSRLDVGLFLVDRFCLGVRTAWHDQIEEAEVGEFREEHFGGDSVEKEGAWGRKLVEGAVDYARKFGFKPSRHYKKAARVFGGIKPEDCGETFVYGREGKPFFMPSPDDSEDTVRKIIQQLGVRCGEGNFSFLVPVKEDPLADEVDELLERIENRAFEGVEARLRELGEEHPESALVPFALGMLFVMQNEQERAIPHLDEALRLSPDMALAWYNKGIAHKSLMEIVPMTVSLRQALKYADDDDEFVDVAKDLVDSVAKMAKDDFGLSLDAYLKAGETFDRGFLKMREQEWTEALKDFQKDTGTNPRSHQAYGNMGACLIQLGRIAEARAALQESLRIAPDYAVARQNLDLLKNVDEDNPGRPNPIIREVNSSAEDWS